MPVEISASAVSVRELLSRRDVYCVPPYQREYTWGSQECGQLLEDLFQFTEASAGTPAHFNAYILGGIVLLDTTGESGRATNGAANGHLYDIIDGQQRLITITILLTVLRDLALEDGDAEQAERLQSFLVLQREDGLHHKLQMRSPGDEAFRRLIEGVAGEAVNDPGDWDSLNHTAMERIIENRNQYVHELGQFEPERRAQLAEVLVERCWLVPIITNDLDNAFNAYARLNCSGKLLTINEILKAKLLGAVHRDRRDALSVEWRVWQSRFGEKRFDNLFAYIRTMRGKPGAPIMQENLRIAREAGGAEAFFRDVLTPAATAYERILNAHNGIGDDDSGIGTYLVYLNWLRHADWMPLAIRWLITPDRTQEETVAFFKSLDRLSYGLLLLGTGRDKRVTRFRQVLASLDRGEVLSAHSPLMLTAAEQRNILYNVSNDMHTRNKQACRLLLLRLNDALAGRVTLHPSGDLTVEHVLPRRPGRNNAWSAEFPDSEVRDICIRRLSNLVLVGRKQNDRARNKEFGEKKEIFFPDGEPTGNPIADFLLECETWSPQVIDARDDELMGCLKDLWSLSGPAGRELDK